MSRCDDLAAEFERANRELVQYLTGLDGEQWLKPGVNSPIIQVGDEDEHRAVGTIAHHVARSYERVANGLRGLAAGETWQPPAPGAAARHAQEFAEPDQAGTIALLEERAGVVAAMLRSLSDEDLDREVTTFLGTTPLTTFIQRGVIFHPLWHLSSIRATFETTAEEP